ncbi:MAG: hypothetical protein ABR927_08830 [Bacteroidales bacterium]|jgi:hypothetical protein
MITDNDFIKMKRQMGLLMIYSAIISMLLIVMLLFDLKKNSNRQSFDEISVKRINILESNGMPRLVISNKELSPDVLSYGKTFGIPGGNRPGIIFYNDEGTENGGLTFMGKTDSISGKYAATGHFSFDQYNQNQVLYLQYADENGERTTGLYIDDWHEKPLFPQWRSLYKSAQNMPEGADKIAKLNQLMEPTKGNPAYAHRVFIGKGSNKAAMINLSDKEGKTRIQLIVDSLGTAKLIFLDQNGNIVCNLPESLHQTKYK